MFIITLREIGGVKDAVLTTPTTLPKFWAGNTWALGILVVSLRRQRFCINCIDLLKKTKKRGVYLQLTRNLLHGISIVNTTNDWYVAHGVC